MSGYYQGHPQGGYPPPQQGYGYQQPPPPQGYGQQPPLQNQFQHNAAPPPGPYGAPPPQGQYGGQPGYPPPMPHQQQQWGPPGPHSHQQQHFQPPPTQQGISAPPSPGYDLNIRAQGDAGNDVRNLRAAMEGIGSDKVKLIKILSQPDPLQMALLLHTYDNYNFGGRHPKRNLIDDLKKETSGHLEEGLIALARGPLVQDCHNVHSAIKGLGTKESVLNDVLLGRSNADMRAIKTEYHRIFHKSMESDVKGDLSLKTEDLFRMVMSATRAEESAPIYQQQIDQDADALHHAIAGLGTKQEVVCNILSSRSDGQIRAIAHAFSTRHGGADLEHKIRGDFSGHMQDALLLMVRRATDRAMCDAVQLEETMAGIGTNDSLLVNRVVRVHWTRQSGHLDQVRRAYSHRYKRDLIQRVKGETSGKFENLLVSCLEG